MKVIIYILLMIVTPALAAQSAAVPPKAPSRSKSVSHRPTSASVSRAKRQASAALSDDADFLAAHDAFLSGNLVKLGHYSKRIKNSPLEVYVRYYQLSLELRVTEQRKIPGPLKAGVKTFLSRTEDTPVIDQLRGEWLKVLGRDKMWDTFDLEYPSLHSQDAEVACYSLQSRRRAQGSQMLRDARKLWFADKEQPDSCAEIFDEAISAGIITERDIIQRLRLALESNNVSLAIKLAKKLHGSEYSSFQTMLKDAAADPERYLGRLAPSDARFFFYGPDNVLLRPPPNAAVQLPLSGRGPIPASAAIPPSQHGNPGLAASRVPAPDFSWTGLFSMTAANRLLTPRAAPIDSELSPLPGTSDAAAAWACGPSCTQIGPFNNIPPARRYAKLAANSQRMIALYALERLARQSGDMAYTRWLAIAGYFPPNEQRYFYGRLAYQAARNLDPRSLSWYRAAADTPLDDLQAAWRVRAALRAEDWPEVLSSINAMNAQQQGEAAWQYWKGRALESLGNGVEANKIFASLSGNFNFYGQLASAELMDTATSTTTVPAYKPDEQAIAAMLELPGIQRTLALYRMGMRSEALDEWRWTLRDFDDRKLLTAAEIAKRNKMYDRAIGAAERTVSMHDLSLRYLAPYRTNLQAQIHGNDLDEAWIYGLMRQESRFSSSAKSRTGALGLMQIMPDTARWAARKLGLKGYRQRLVTEIDTNILLGTYYLKAILARADNNPVLASAAYNAGPLKALQWRGDHPMEGAIYIESIPYEETRDYVKKVMSNTVYYADQFGDPPRSLKERLGIVPAKPADNQALEPYVP